jgi:predicted porin
MFFGSATDRTATVEKPMNRKLINLAVAAALAAPAAAMAEATLYGKLHVSIDYADVKNVIQPEFETVNSGTITSVVSTNGTTVVEGEYVDDDGDTGPWTAEVQTAILQQNPELVDALLGGGVPVVRVDANGRAIAVPGTGQDFKGWGVSRGNSYIPGASRANRVGVKGSEDLGGGLKAIYQVEFGVNLSDTNDNVISNADAITMRNSFVGLAGGFGTFLVGRHDTPHKISTGKLDLFTDTMADYNGTVGFQDIRADNAIAYISPSWAGFQLAAAAIAPGGATAGFGESTETDSIAEAWSVAGIYKNGPFYASAAYELLGADHFMTQATTDAGKCDPFALECNYVDDDFTKYRFGLGILDWNGFTLTAIYENQDNVPLGQTRSGIATIDPDGNVSIGSVQNGFKSQNLYQVQAGYSFGNNTIKGMYGWMDRDSERAFSSTRGTVSIDNLRKDLSGDASTWAIAFDHNFSKRTRAYALYVSVDDDRSDNPLPTSSSADWEGFSLGMIHSF